MDLSRRDILLGIAAAIGGATYTGAYVQEEVQREFTVSVANDNDDNVQLPIVPQGAETDRVRISQNSDGIGVLNIDATNIPVDSVATFGKFDDRTDPETLSTEVFSIHNNNALEKPLVVTLSIDNTEDKIIEIAVAPADSEGEFDQADVVVLSGAEPDAPEYGHNYGAEYSSLTNSEASIEIDNGEQIVGGLWIDAETETYDTTAHMTIDATVTE